MAQDIVGSLFGPTPYEIQQNQRKAMDEMAWKYAQAEPFVGARAGLFSAAGGLAGAGADALGWKNTEVEQARAREAAMTGFDPSSSKSILEKAASVSDPKLKMQLQMLGNQRAKEEQEALLKASQAKSAEARAEREAETARYAGFTPMMKEAMATADSSYERGTPEWRDLYGKALEEGRKKDAAEKISGLARELVDAGYAYGSPEFRTEMRRRIAADVTGKSKGSGAQVQVKVDTKLGESVASQVGPMLKEGRVAAQGAIKLDDQANRILKALDTNSVISGPLASASMKVRQVFDPQGKSPTIVETRKVIRALAEGAVNARKALEGQGSITENEAAAAAKAEAGELDDLTIGELRVIANMNKRAARIRASEYSELLSTAAKDETTKGIAKFYAVPGIDKLLQEKPPANVSKVSVGKAPANVDPAVWAIMTPEERKLWPKQ